MEGFVWLGSRARVPPARLTYHGGDFTGSPQELANSSRKPAPAAGLDAAAAVPMRKRAMAPKPLEAAAAPRRDKAIIAGREITQAIIAPEVLVLPAVVPREEAHHSVTLSGRRIRPPASKLMPAAVSASTARKGASRPRVGPRKPKKRRAALETEQDGGPSKRRPVSSGSRRNAAESAPPPQHAKPTNKASATQPSHGGAVEPASEPAAPRAIGSGSAFVVGSPPTQSPRLIERPPRTGSSREDPLLAKDSGEWLNNFADVDFINGLL